MKEKVVQLFKLLPTLIQVFESNETLYVTREEATARSIDGKVIQWWNNGQEVKSREIKQQ